jgi:hypothetical protein
MLGKCQLRKLLYAVAFSALALGAQAPPAGGDEAARRKGWDLLQQAREAFQGGGAAAVRDYSFDAITNVHTPKGVTQLTSKAFVVCPDSVRPEIQTPQGKAVIVFDGEKGWQQSAAGRKEVSAEAAKQIRAELARNNLLIGPEPDPAYVRYVGPDEVSGRPVEIVQIADVGGTLLRVFIDTETHDVLKHMFVGDTPQGLAQVEEIFSDVRESGGPRWYHQRKVLRNGEIAIEGSRSNLRVNVGYDEAMLLGAGPAR